MNYIFSASHLFGEDDDYMAMVGFSDYEIEPKKYVILQKAHKYDEQDVKMGMDNVYLEIEDQSRSNYGGINSVEVIAGKILITLSDETKSALSIGGDIEVQVSDEHPDFEKVKTMLKSICEAEDIFYSA